MSRLSRALLPLAPRRLRARHGRDMEELFAERLAAARARGRRAAATVWLRAISDLIQARLAGLRPERVPLTVYIDERTTFMAGSDIRYAWRALLRQRGATTLVVLMLALGIAANVAVFSLVNGLFLRPFPFPHPERLVYINTAAPTWNLDVVGINYPDFDRWRKDQKLFEAITAYETSYFNLADAGGAERVRGLQITYHQVPRQGREMDDGRRRGGRREALRARAPDASGPLFPAGAGSAADHDARAARVRGSCVGHSVGPRRAPVDGRRDPALSRADDGGLDPAVNGAARRVVGSFA